MFVACKFLYPCSHFLSLCASFGLKSIFCRPHISGSCVIIQSVILSLLIKAFSLLTSFCNGHLFCFYHHMMLHAHLVFSLPLPLNQPLFQGTLVGSFYRRMNFRNQGSQTVAVFITIALLLLLDPMVKRSREYMYIHQLIHNLCICISISIFCLFCFKL